MQAIHEYHQSQIIGNDPNVGLAVSLFGKSAANIAVGLGRLAGDVAAGRWDEEIQDPAIGPSGRCLLLTFLGSRHTRLLSQYGQQAPDENVVAVARAMVDRGADPLAKDQDGLDSLDQAVAIGEHDLVREWARLVSQPQSLQDRRLGGGPQNQLQLPWLHQAARAANPSMLQALLDAGLDPNHVNEHEQTALFWASSPEVVALLVQAGCDPWHRDAMNQDAKLFWSSQRGLPQTSINPMAAELPRVSPDQVPRAQQVADFYRQAMTSGKGTLAPILAKLKLLPGELDSEGFGLIGNLGSRLLDAASSRSGTATNKTVHWAEHLLENQHVRAAASRKDWMRLWIGGCRFGLARAGMLGKFDDAPWRFDPDFYRTALEQSFSVPDSGLGSYRSSMLLEMSRDIRRAAQGATVSVAPHLAQLSAQCLVHAHASRNPHDASPFWREQEEFMKWMLEHPHLNVEQASVAWSVALCIDNAAQTQNSKLPRLHLPLVQHLVECRTPFPDHMSASLAQAMEALSGAELEALADVHAQLLASQTAPAIKSNHRPRL